MCIRIQTSRALTNRTISAYKVFFKTAKGLHSLYYGNSSAYNNNGNAIQPEDIENIPEGYVQDTWISSGEPGFQAFLKKRHAKHWAEIHADRPYEIVKVKMRKVLGTGRITMCGFPNNCACAALEMFIPK
jgi:hypothetical protein